jgi:hypothetical protein
MQFKTATTCVVSRKQQRQGLLAHQTVHTSQLPDLKYGEDVPAFHRQGTLRTTVRRDGKHDIRHRRVHPAQAVQYTPEGFFVTKQRLACGPLPSLAAAILA